MHADRSTNRGRSFSPAGVIGRHIAEVDILPLPSAGTQAPEGQVSPPQQPLCVNCLTCVVALAASAGCGPLPAVDPDRRRAPERERVLGRLLQANGNHALHRRRPHVGGTRHRHGLPSADGLFGKTGRRHDHPGLRAQRRHAGSEDQAVGDVRAALHRVARRRADLQPPDLRPPLRLDV